VQDSLSALNDVVRRLYLKDQSWNQVRYLGNEEYSRSVEASLHFHITPSMLCRTFTKIPRHVPNEHILLIWMRPYLVMNFSSGLSFTECSLARAAVVLLLANTVSVRVGTRSTVASARYRFWRRLWSKDIAFLRISTDVDNCEAAWLIFHAFLRWFGHG
jgi:hypothetical protein